MRRSMFFGLCSLLAILAMLAPLAPLMAVDAYVPLAANLPLGAATYRTLLIATNTGNANAAFNVTFLASGTDGTGGNPQPSSFGLSPGTTLRVYNAVPSGARGMLAVSGDPAIAVSARVEALAANGNVLASAQVPIVTASNAYGPDKRAELQGAQQTASGPATDLGLMNLSGSPAHCTVQAFRSDGGKIANAVSLTLPPRSNNDFTGALARLGQTSVKDARFDVTCDQAFGTYALIYRSGGPETVALGPGAVLDGDLKPDGDGGVTFNLPGLFANGSNFAGFDLPLQDGAQYGRAHMELDLLIDQWHQVFPFNPNFQTVASFRRSANKRSDRVLYWGLILKGTGDYNTILDMGIPPGSSEGTTLRSGKGPWKEHTTYHLVFDYDADKGGIVFEVYQGGALVQRMTGPLNNKDISNQPGKTVRVDFSAAGVGDGAYFPTLGWKYSNLAVKLIPRGH
jgi:hypothetical protein